VLSQPRANRCANPAHSTIPIPSISAAAWTLCSTLDHKGHYQGISMTLQQLAALLLICSPFWLQAGAIQGRPPSDPCSSAEYTHGLLKVIADKLVIHIWKLLALLNLQDGLNTSSAVRQQPAMSWFAGMRIMDNIRSEVGTVAALQKFSNRDPCDDEHTRL